MSDFTDDYDFLDDLMDDNGDTSWQTSPKTPIVAQAGEQRENTQKQPQNTPSLKLPKKRPILPPNAHLEKPAQNSAQKSPQNRLKITPQKPAETQGQTPPKTIPKTEPEAGLKSAQKAGLKAGENTGPQVVRKQAPKIALPISPTDPRLKQDVKRHLSTATAYLDDPMQRNHGIIQGRKIADVEQQAKQQAQDAGSGLNTGADDALGDSQEHSKDNRQGGQAPGVNPQDIERRLKEKIQQNADDLLQDVPINQAQMDRQTENAHLSEEEEGQLKGASFIANTFENFSARVRIVDEDESAANTKRGKRYKVGAFSPGVSPNARIRGITNSRINSAEIDLIRRLGEFKYQAHSNPLAMRNVRPQLRQGSVPVVDRKIDENMASTFFAKDEVYAKGRAKKMTEADYATLRFLAMFKYATAKHITQLTGNTMKTVEARLRKLQMTGMVSEKDIYGNLPIWFLTQAGMVVSGFELPLLVESRLSYNLFPHQFAVNHIASALVSASINVLNDDNFPHANRFNRNGEKIWGETLVSELEISSSLGREKAMWEIGEELNPRLRKDKARQFAIWDKKRDQALASAQNEEEELLAQQMPSPEMQVGNEFMYALLPKYSLGLTWHLPDLVVKRPRNANKTPNAIAIEVELNTKTNPDSYRKTLLAYEDDTLIYNKVIWICKTASIARKVQRIAEAETNLIKDGRIEFLPIITSRGIFKGRDAWLL